MDEVLLHSALPASIIPLLPQSICITHATAILLREFCAIYDLPPTLPLYAIHNTILAVAIPCKGQTLTPLWTRCCCTLLFQRPNEVNPRVRRKPTRTPPLAYPGHAKLLATDLLNAQTPLLYTHPRNCTLTPGRYMWEGATHTKHLSLFYPRRGFCFLTVTAPGSP